MSPSFKRKTEGGLLEPCEKQVADAPSEDQDYLSFFYERGVRPVQMV